MVSRLIKPVTMVPIDIMRSRPAPQNSPRTLHTCLYNWSKSPVTTWRCPTYRAETCRCYNPPVILEANIVVFDCVNYQASYYCTKHNGDDAHQKFVITFATSHAANSDERWLYGHHSHGNIALQAPFRLRGGLPHRRNTFIVSTDCEIFQICTCWHFALFRHLQTYHAIL